MVVGSAFVIGELTSRLLRPAFDSGSTSTTALGLAAVVLLGVALLRITGILGRRLGGGAMQFRLQARYRRLVTRKYLELSPRWHQSRSTGTLLSVANSDVEASWGIMDPMPYAVGTVVMLLAATVALLVVDPMLALVGLLVFPAVISLSAVYSRYVTPKMRTVQRQRAQIADIAHESFEGALVVKVLGRADSETDRFAARAERLRDSLVSVGRARGVFDPLMDALPNVGTIAVLAVGAYRLEAGAVSLGQVVSVAFLFTVLALPLRAIGWVLVDLPRTTVGADRVRQVLNARDTMSYGTRRLNESGGCPPAATLSFDHVSFSYPQPVADGPVSSQTSSRAASTDTPDALTDVTLEVPAGRTVALVGPTGSGKSTLVMLAARLLDPDVGTIRLDGAELRELAEGELSSAVSLVSQSAFAFDDTVRGNLTLGVPYPDSQLWTALEAASVADVVAALPDRLNTRVGERGTSLSGGQRQRLTLARALLRQPRLLLLDDATSSVDPIVEQQVLRGIQQAAHHPGRAEGGTVLLVAHRRASIALADEVIYLAGGRVVAQGSHDQLLRIVPGYADLMTAYDDAKPTQREVVSP
jgi:ABC-type multidrug transport system fused ATPase/permease subunit